MAVERPPSPVPGTRFGWVKSFEVTEDREIIMTCYDPGEGQDVLVRVLRMELETMLAARPSPPKRRGGPAQTPTRST